MTWRIPLDVAAKRLEARYTKLNRIQGIEPIVVPSTGVCGYFANAILLHVPVWADAYDGTVKTVRVDKVATYDAGKTLGDRDGRCYENPTLGRTAFWYATLCIDYTLQAAAPTKGFRGWMNAIARRAARLWQPILEDYRSTLTSYGSAYQHKELPYDRPLPPISYDFDLDEAAAKFTIKSDPFDVDLRKKPKTKTYQWKMQSVFGENDPRHILEMLEGGWKFVPAKRHPEVKTEDKKKKVILVQGMCLMEKATKKVDAAYDELRSRALSRVAAVWVDNHTIQDAKWPP